LEKELKAQNYSSGIESDNDLDLLVEQEVLQAMRMRREYAKKGYMTMR